MYNFLRSEINIKGKIGVYGRSMGGIPASSISQKADMVILDRTFSSFNAMAYWKYHGMLADILFKFYFCGYEI